MITLLFFIFTAACSIVFLHYCIGSPIQGEFYTGRIFSKYGKFISDKYNQFERKEKERVWAKYNDWKLHRDQKLNEDLQNKSAEESQLIYSEYLQQVDAVFNTVEDNMRANPYSMLGACPICFGTWVALLIYIFFVIFVQLPAWYIIVGVPASVVLSRYIKLT